MLKIKSNVDLKELEKFGFEKIKYGFFNIYQTSTDLGEDSSKKPCLRVREYLREIQVYGGKMTINSPNINLLYDLIKADLVEKVEDKGE